jgi:hypothetical protein
MRRDTVRVRVRRRSGIKMQDAGFRTQDSRRYGRVRVRMCRYVCVSSDEGEDGIEGTCDVML